jgi:hypothetical protein
MFVPTKIANEQCDHAGIFQLKFDVNFDVHITVYSVDGMRIKSLVSRDEN